MNRLKKHQKKTNHTIFDRQSQKLKIIIEGTKASSYNSNINKKKELTALESEIKIERLTKKLQNRQIEIRLNNNKLKREPLIYDRKRRSIDISEESNNTFESNNHQTIYKPKIYHIKQMKSEICRQGQFQINILKQYYDQVCKKMQLNKMSDDLKQQKNKDNLNSLQIYLQEMKKNIVKIDHHRIELTFLGNNLKRKINRNSPIMKPVGLMKENNVISSINHDGSLLLSFKKNLDEDDSFLAYKYSEDSIKHMGDKKYDKDAQKYRQTFESFSKDKMSNVAHKLSYKSKVIESQQSEMHQPDCFGIIKDQIHLFLSQQKTNFELIKQQAIKGEERCQKIFQNMLYEIATQEVQRQDYFKQIIIQFDEQFQNLHSMIQQMQKMHTKSIYSLQQKASSVKQNVRQKLQSQQKTRKQDQKSIIKMLFEIVQFLQ